MLDCGLPWPKAKKAFVFATSSVSAVLLGHSHGDHSQGVSGAAAAGIDIYLLPETKSELGLSGHRYHEIEPLKQFSVGTLTVLPFPLEHDVPNCGFLIADQSGDKVCYINDTCYSRYRFREVGIYAIEVNYSKATMSEGIPLAHRLRVMRSHMSLETVLAFLRANDLRHVREIHLLHLSDDNSDEQAFKAAVQSATGIPAYVAPKQSISAGSGPLLPRPGSFGG
jgi:phosphoribosyl 1,2-cyclic phosphodiesterase